jgi:hypothetical protein
MIFTRLLTGLMPLILLRPERTPDQPNKMLSIIFESMLINFPSRVLNIFLSPNGYGNILSQTDGVLTSNEPNAQFGLFSLSIFFIHLTLCTMV